MASTITVPSACNSLSRRRSRRTCHSKATPGSWRLPLAQSTRSPAARSTARALAAAEGSQFSCTHSEPPPDQTAKSARQSFTAPDRQIEGPPIGDISQAVAGGAGWAAARRAVAVWGHRRSPLTVPSLIA